MSELTQGLTISGFGILITFSALGILIGLIVLLKLFFPAASDQAPVESGQGDTFSHPVEKEKLSQQAAGVAVGVLLSQKDRSDRGNLGKLLEEPPGSWWRQGLDRVQGKE